MVYIADDTSFNEAFAVTVEQEGLARWLKARGREPDLARHLDRRKHEEQAMRIVSTYRGRLATLYASGAAAEEMRRSKAGLFGALVEELRALAAGRGVKSILAEELAAAPSNARIAALATYYDCVPGFQRVLAEQQHDLTKFYAAVHELAKLPKGQRHAKLCASLQVQ
jgi:predicted aminopeptidase